MSEKLHCNKFCCMFNIKYDSLLIRYITLETWDRDMIKQCIIHCNDYSQSFKGNSIMKA